MGRLGTVRERFAEPLAEGATLNAATRSRTRACYVSDGLALTSTGASALADAL